LIADLLLTAGVPWPTILWTVFLDEVMIVTGLVGALVSTSYKWGYFALGCAAMFGVFWNIAWEGRKQARSLGADVSRTYLLCGVWTLLIWLLYPIAWGLVCETRARKCRRHGTSSFFLTEILQSEGGNVIAPDSEAVFYGVLDFCAKPIFSIVLIIGHWKIDPARLGLKLRDYSEEPNAYAVPHQAVAEKSTNGHGAEGVTNGHGTNGTDANAPAGV
jgi:bacteriorhodopsin